MALQVVLASYEIPHEVSPVHVVQLVVYEELYIFPLCRHYYLRDFASTVVAYLLAFYFANPVFVKINLVGTVLRVLLAVHSGEQHILCIHQFGLVSQQFV